MLTRKIIEKINALKIDDANEYDALEEVSFLTGELKKNDDGQFACESLIGLLERHSLIEFGSPGEPIHTIENFPGYYEEYLFKSLERHPTNMTVWMLNRMINAETDENSKKSLIDKLRNCVKHTLADKQTQDSAKDFLKYQKRHTKSID